MILRYTRQALADLDQARDHIALHDPKAAPATAFSIRSAIDGLRLFPERGRIGRLTGTRELIVPRTNFIVPYRVTPETVDILAILHAARSWPQAGPSGTMP